MSLVRLTLVALLAVAAAPATAQTAVRADDLEVRAQMEQVRRVLDRYIGSVDPQVRPAALTSLKTAAARMISNYRPPAATAAPMVADFFRQAKAFESSLKAGSTGPPAAWTDLVPWIAELGHSYHIEWQSEPSSWVPRRVSDQELRLSAASLAAASEDLADMLGSVVKKDRVMDSVERNRTVRQLEALASSASDLLHRVTRYDDVSAVVPRLVKAAADLKPFISTYPAAAAVQGQWQSTLTAIETITLAYDVSS